MPACCGSVDGCDAASGGARPELRGHQSADLELLRRFVLTLSRSRFYWTVHRGLDRAPLAELPPLSKATLMDNFDQISTQPMVRLAALQAYLDGRTDNARSTAGTGCRPPTACRHGSGSQT